MSCYSLGVAGFRAPGLHLVLKLHQGVAGDPALCTHCLLFTPPCVPPSGPHEGPAKQVSPASWLFPSPLLQLTSCPDYKHLFPFARSLWGSSYSIDFICIAEI